VTFFLAAVVGAGFGGAIILYIFWEELFWPNK